MPCQGSEWSLVMQTLQGFCQDSGEKCQHFAGTPLMLYSCCLCPAGGPLVLRLGLFTHVHSSPTFVQNLVVLVYSLLLSFGSLVFNSQLLTASLSVTIFQSNSKTNPLSFPQETFSFNATESGTCSYLPPTASI